MNMSKAHEHAERITRLVSRIKALADLAEALANVDESETGMRAMANSLRAALDDERPKLLTFAGTPEKLLTAWRASEPKVGGDL